MTPSPDTQFTHSAAWTRLRKATNILRDGHPDDVLQVCIWIFEGTFFDRNSFDQLCLDLGVKADVLRSNLLARYPSAQQFCATATPYETLGRAMLSDRSFPD